MNDLPVRARPHTATTPTGVRMVRSRRAASSQTCGVMPRVWRRRAAAAQGSGERASCLNGGAEAGAAIRCAVEANDGDRRRGLLFTSMSPVVSLNRMSCSGPASTAGKVADILSARVVESAEIGLMYIGCNSLSALTRTAS